MVGPSGTEPDVSIADGSPREKRGETRERDKPIEDGTTRLVQVDIGKQAPGETEADRREGSATAVDVREDLGSISLLCESSEGTASTIHSRHADRHNRNQNDKVHEMVKALKASVFADQDEGRRARVVGDRAGQGFIVVRDQKTDEQQTDDVKANKGMLVPLRLSIHWGQSNLQRDTPEDLLDSARKRLDGILGLGSSKTNQFRSTEREGSSDEDGTKTTETIGPRARIIPQPTPPVLAVLAVRRTATQHADEGDDDEDDRRTKLQTGRPELFFSIAERAEDVDNQDNNKEHGDPDTLADLIIPIRDGDCDDSEF